LNSNYGIKFIILSNIFELTQISEGLKPIRKFELNQRKNCEMQLCTVGQLRPGPTLSAGLSMGEAGELALHGAPATPRPNPAMTDEEVVRDDV
jgi:hypothetical protein